MEDGVLVHVLGGDDFLDDAVHQDLSHVLQLDVLVVLDGDDDRVHALGDASAVFERVFACDLNRGERVITGISSYWSDPTRPDRRNTGIRPSEVTPLNYLCI